MSMKKKNGNISHIAQNHAITQKHFGKLELNSIEFSLNVLLEKEPKKELGASPTDIYTRLRLERFIL